MSVADAESAMQVGRRLLRAIDEECWDDAAACIDPGLTLYVYDSALQRMRRDREAELDAAARSAEASASSIDVERRPTVIRVAAHRVLRRLQPDEDVESLEELEAMTALEFMARTLANGSRAATRLVRFQGLRRIVPGGLDPPEMRILRLVIAEARETDDLVHIVYRRLLRSGTRTHLLEPIGVATFHRVSGTWYARGPAQAGCSSPLQPMSDRYWQLAGTRATPWF